MDRRIADDGFRLSAKGIASGLAITELCEVAIFLLHVLRYHRLYFTTPQLQTLYVTLGYDNILIHQNNIMVHCTQTCRTSECEFQRINHVDPAITRAETFRMTFQNRNFQLKRSYNNIIRIVDVPLHIGRSPINKYAKIKWMSVTKYKTVVHDITVQHYIANLGQCKRACTTADFMIGTGCSIRPPQWRHSNRGFTLCSDILSWDDEDYVYFIFWFLDFGWKINFYILLFSKKKKTEDVFFSSFFEHIDVSTFCFH